MPRAIVCLMFLVAIVRPTLAQEPSDLAPLLKPILEKHKLPGMVAAVVEGDKVVGLGAVGVRKSGFSNEFTKGDLVHLGSDTKAMTALLIGQLIEEKKLGFDTTLAELFPDLAEKMKPEFKNVTVKQVMSHTAGLPANVIPAEGLLRGKSLVEQRALVLEKALTEPPDSPPGSKFLYSNTGYMILGAIIDIKSGQPWEEAIAKRLFEPLKMNTAGFGPPGREDKIEQPWGHRLAGDQLTPSFGDNPAAMNPAGRVHCSIADWAKFVSLFLDSEQGKPRLVGTETFKALTTAVPPGQYAGGWLIAPRPWAGGDALTHSGSNTLWYCVAWVAPKRNFAVLLATNVGGDDAAKACDEAATAILLDRAAKAQQQAK